MSSPLKAVTGWSVCAVCGVLHEAPVGTLCNACGTGGMVALSAAQQLRLNYWCDILTSSGTMGQWELHHWINALVR